MIPQLSDQKLEQIAERSKAEVTFYKNCRNQLDNRFVVFFSVPWIGTDNKGNVRDGEIDFMIFDPNSGFLVVEIKGGGITYKSSTDEWLTINKSGTFTIKNPFAQAKNNKHKVLEILKSHPRWNRTGVSKVLMAHAVFFPDLHNVDKLIMPQSPREIMGCSTDFESFNKWVDNVLSYWQGQGEKFQPLGNAVISLAEAIFSRPIDVRPLLASQLEDEEKIRIQLTDQQAYLLSALGTRKRAAISGGAGTGKTLLAINKASKLAESGIRTLLICYNRPLADHLKKIILGNENLLPMTYHQLCDWRRRIVKDKIGRDLLQEAKRTYPGGDLFDVQLPYALALSTEIIGERFDAIIIDEGQDFSDDYWLAIEMLLSHPKDSYLYIFFDHNQALYKKASTFPIYEEPFILSSNCRNTKFIHDAAYHYYNGSQTDAPSITGEPIGAIVAPSVAAQAKKLHAQLVKLIQHEKVKPENITILTIQDPAQAYFDLLKSMPLPQGIKWSFAKHDLRDTILIETAKRFKGLEADIIFLWGLDDLDERRNIELIYVALSRAKSRLYVVCNEEYDLDAVLKGQRINVDK